MHEADRRRRRQDLRHPLDDPRRGRPRARHAQHVHGLPPQPRHPVPQLRQRRQPRVGHPQEHAPVRLRPVACPTPTPAAATCRPPTARSASASDPANGSFTVRDLNLAQGVDDKRFDRRKDILGTVDNHFRTMEKSDALDAMDSFYQQRLRPDQLARRPARRSTSRASRSTVKEAYGKNAAGMRHADGPPARRGGRAVRLADLRRVGPPRRHRPGLQAARCRRSTRRSPP